MLGGLAWWEMVGGGVTIIIRNNYRKYGLFLEQE